MVLEYSGIHHSVLGLHVIVLLKCLYFCGFKSWGPRIMHLVVAFFFLAFLVTGGRG